MKTRPFHFGLVLGLFVLGGCAGKAGKTVPSQAQLGPEFRPKKVYALEMKQAWDVTLKALKKEGIPLAMANKDIWVIRTDYQNLSSWERNKCDIRFSQEPQRNTYIFVHCQYEGRKDATEPFRDFTYSAPRKAMKAEEEMYRKLEPHILSFERTSPGQEEVSAKAALPPLPEKPASKTEAATPAILPAAAASLAAPEGKAETVSPPPPPAAVAEKPQSAARAAPPAESKGGAAAFPFPVLPRKSEIKEETLFAPLVTVGSTNVRVAPSTQSRIAAVLKKGERVEKIGESGSWTRIKLSTAEDAWVFTDLLQPATSEPSPGTTVREAQPSPPEKPEQARQTPVAKAGEPTQKGVDGPAKTIFMTQEVTKMWAEPNSKSKVVLVLKKGRKVEKLAESGEFTKVKLPWGDSGWVLTRFLQPAP
jgi:SH3-like domain-containing protein